MPNVTTQQHFRVPHALSLLIAHNKRAQALKFLDKLIGSDYGIFGADSQILNDRQAALQFKIDLLLEWNRYSEALAWLCLETEINPNNVYAQALKERLKRSLHIDDLHRRQFEPVRSGRKCAADGGAFNWEGVAGMRELKLTLENDIIMPFLEPDIYNKYRVPLPNGILFYGPPGCGKTFIARKLATILNYNFIELKPSDLASIYVHGTQGKIGDIFREAGGEQQTILFFDEIDAFIPSREQGIGHHYSAEVNEFLVQMNECAKRGVMVIGATNYLSHVDGAVKRPGRFDKKIYIGTPDLEARVEAIKLYMKDRPQEKIEYFSILSDKDLYSYADLELVVNEAARKALRYREPVTREYLEAAFGAISASITKQMITEMSKE